jgi:hypothetical protein
MADKPLSPRTITLFLTRPASWAQHYPRRLFIASALMFLTCIILGCMSLSFGEHNTTITHEDGLLIQEDTIELHGAAAQTIYYPVPYAGPPNLVVESTFHTVVIEEQAADHFRVRCDDPFGKVDWKAKGQRVPPPTPPIVVAPVVTAPVVPPPDTAKH